MAQRKTNLVERRTRQKRSRQEQNNRIGKARELAKTTAILVIAVRELNKPAYHRADVFNDAQLVHRIEEKTRFALEKFVGLPLPQILHEYLGIPQSMGER